MNRPSFPAQAEGLHVVSFDDRDVLDATRLLARIVQTARSPTVSRSATPFARPSTAPDAGELLQRAKRDLSNRRRRRGIFGESMFGEPAWDMLLILYTEQGGQRLTVASLTRLSGAAATTALRWVDMLEGRRLITRQPHPLDGRAQFVDLTNEAIRLMETYLSGTDELK